MGVTNFHIKAEERDICLDSVLLKVCPLDTAMGHEGLVSSSSTSPTITRVDCRADSNVVVLIVIGLGHGSHEDLMEQHTGRRKIPSETSQPT